MDQKWTSGHQELFFFVEWFNFHFHFWVYFGVKYKKDQKWTSGHQELFFFVEWFNFHFHFHF